MDQALPERPIYLIRRAGRLADCRLECAGGGNFLTSAGADLVGGDFGHRDGPAVKGREFDLVTAAAFIDVNDRPHITHGQPMVGEIGGQRHAIQLFDHAGKGYAVMKRGAMNWAVNDLISPWVGWTREAGMARLLSSLGTPAESAAVAQPSNRPIRRPSGRARSAGGREWLLRARPRGNLRA